MRGRRLRWSGNVYRMDSNRLPRQVMDWTPLDFRSRGPKSVVDFNSKKGSVAAGCDVGRSIGLSKGSLGMEKLYTSRARCAPVARGRTKV